MLTVGTFGFLHLTNSVPSVSAVSATGSIAVYSDPSCAKTVSSIDWGVLSPGQTKKVVVYARNEGNETILLTVTSANYSPVNASDYLNFTWTCVDPRIAANKTVEVTQSLYVSPTAAGISSFSFNIVFSGNEYILGDINGDGAVNMLDVIALASAFLSRPGDKNWNPLADLNQDGVVDMIDSIILANVVNLG
jgi:hypothetical protein